MWIVIWYTIFSLEENPLNTIFSASITIGKSVFIVFWHGTSFHMPWQVCKHTGKRHQDNYSVRVITMIVMFCRVLVFQVSWFCIFLHLSISPSLQYKSVCFLVETNWKYNLCIDYFFLAKYDCVCEDNFGSSPSFSELNKYLWMTLNFHILVWIFFTRLVQWTVKIIHGSLLLSKTNFLSVRENENINIQISHGYLICPLELADNF